jgi:hypothetical protein
MKTRQQSTTITLEFEVEVTYQEILSTEGQDADGNRGYLSRECIAEHAEVLTRVPEPFEGFLKAQAIEQWERDYA